MGVTNLWTLLEPCGRRVDVQTLRGKRVAVDASGWIFRFIKAMRDEQGELLPNAHLIGFFRRICKLLFHNIKPVFIFDGSTPALKRQTVIERRRAREQQETRVRKTAERLLLNRLKQHVLSTVEAQPSGENGSNAVAQRDNQSEQQEPAKEPAPGGSGANVNAPAGGASVAEGGAAAQKEEVPGLSTAEAVQQALEAVAAAASTSDSEDFDYEPLLPEGDEGVDPAVLATLPPSMQLEVMMRLRDRRTAANRSGFEQRTGKPEAFSQYQMQQYLRASNLRRQLDIIRGANGAGQDAARPIAAEEGKEYILTADEVPAPADGTDASSQEKHPPLSQEAAASAAATLASGGGGTGTGTGTGTGGRGASAAAAGVPEQKQAKALDVSFVIKAEEVLSDDSMEWEDIDNDNQNGNDDEPPNSNDPDAAAKLLHWRERAAQRQKYWSLSHGFQMGRKLASWGEKEEGGGGGGSGAAGAGAKTEEGQSVVDDEDAQLQEAIRRSLVSADEQGDGENGDYAEPLWVNAEPAEPAESAEHENNSRALAGASDGGGAGPSCVPSQPPSLQPPPQHEIDMNQDMPSSITTEQVEATFVEEDLGGINQQSEVLENSPAKSALPLPAVPSPRQTQVLPAEVPVVSKESSAPRSPLKTAPIAPTPAVEKSSPSPLLDAPLPLVAEEASLTPWVADKEVVAQEEHAEQSSAKPAADHRKQNELTGQIAQRTAPKKTVHFAPELEDVLIEQAHAEEEEHTSQGEATFIRSSERPQEGNSIHRPPEPAAASWPTSQSAPSPGAGPSNSGAPPWIAPDFTEDSFFPGGPMFDQESLIREEASLRLERRAAVGQSDTPTDLMYTECQELLQLFGLPYLIAPFEAEAQCAWLDAQGLVEGVVTDDNDAFLFGARRVYRHIFEGAKYVEEYRSAEVETELGLGRDRLVALALLLGSDYTPGVKGVGVVNAVEVVSAFRGVEGLRRFAKWMHTIDDEIMALAKTAAGGGGNEQEEEEDEEGATAAEATFKAQHRNVRKVWNLPSGFPSIEVMEAYTDPKVDASKEKFGFARPDLELLRRFCSERFGWDTGRTDELLLPVLTAYDERQTQQTLDSFVAYRQKFAKIRSKRLQKAVSGIADADKDEMVLSEGGEVGDGGEGDQQPKAAPKPRKRKAKTAPVLAALPEIEVEIDEVATKVAAEQAAIEATRGKRRSRRGQQEQLEKQQQQEAEAQLGRDRMNS